MITFQIDPWDTFIRDAHYLFPEHYAELSLDKERFQLSLYEDRYRFAEKEGVLHIVTARDDETVIGYWVGAVLPHLHYSKSGLMASTDMYFLTKASRSGNLGFRFVSFIENSLIAKGVVKLYVSWRVHRDLQKFWESLGYRFTDKMFTKLLEAH